jgi:polyhydroxybutyrate depolymerase
VPILNIHGTADRYAPIEGGIRRSLLGRVVLRRASEPMMGVDEWAQFWVSANGALDGPLVRSLPPDTTIRAWHGPTPSSDVVFYRVDGAGHTWPGSGSPLPAFLFGRTSRTFDATTVSWEFLAAHTL